MAKKKTRADGLVEKTVTINGKRKHFYGHSEAEVIRKIADYSGEVKNGRSFRAVAEEWQRETFDRIAIGTLKPYKIYSSIAIDFFGDIPIQKITTKDIQRFINQYAKNRAQKTARNVLSVLSQIFKTAVMDGDIEYNPCVNVMIPKGLPTQRRQAPNEEEIHIVRENIDLDAAGFLFFLCLYSGLRKGEALALQWEDIDFEKNDIHVYKSVTFDSNTPSIKPPKTDNGVRYVPLLLPLKEELMKRKGNSKEYIFSYDGSLWTKRYADKRIDYYKKVTGLQRGLHEMRHGFATICFEAGLDPKSTQHILGHSDLRTTMDIYTHFSSRVLRDVTDRLNKHVGK